jgi:subtilisin family serine protease
LTIPAAGGLQAQPARLQPASVPGELIVKYRADATAAEHGRARAAVRARSAASLSRTAHARVAGHIELMTLPAAASTQAALAVLRRDPAVEYAEPNWIYTHAAAPDDPFFAQQWGLENTGQAVNGLRGIADADVDAIEAWDGTAAAGPVYVGVIDEGIDFNHPDLGVQPAGAVWTNPFDPVDGIDNDGNGYVDDVHGWDFASNDGSVYDGSAGSPSVDAHGTHVAGTIGARTGNGIGVAGVSPGVVIVPAKFLAVGGGTTAGAILAVDYLTDLKIRHGLNIIATNNSWTGGGYSQALLEAIARAAREDILFIAAAGNGGQDRLADDNDTDVNYPSAYDTSSLAGYDAVVAVTATDQSDQLTAWSNYGFRSVDLSAPGASIVSTSPQNTYSYSSGTSMATPHVTGAAVLVHSIGGARGRELRELLLDSVDPIAALAGRTATGGRLNAARAVNAGNAAAPTGGEILLHPAKAQKVTGNWAVRADTTAAGGARLQSTNLGAAKVSPALSSPSNYFEMTFEAQARTPYRLWVRARAEGDHWANDSVHVQFDGSVTSTGSPVYRIGSSSSAAVNLEDCSGCGVSGWGWQDNGYGKGVLGPALYFATSGTQRIRVQIREDGVAVDQIVLSGRMYLSSAPGVLKNDATVLTGGGGTSSPTAGDTAEIVLHAANAATLAGYWSKVPDSTAASGTRLQNPNASAARVTTALASPADYFEIEFMAGAGKAYRLWIRGRATSNGWANDSVHVQFDSAVSATGAPLYRIGSTSSAEVNLEDCSGCGLSGWGWQDNGYGAGVLGPEIRFAADGKQKLRIQVREDGLGIDQIVLSAGRFLTTAPGALKNDGTILGDARP